MARINFSRSSSSSEMISSIRNPFFLFQEMRLYIARPAGAMVQTRPDLWNGPCGSPKDTELRAWSHPGQPVRQPRPSPRARPSTETLIGHEVFFRGTRRSGLSDIPPLGENLTQGPFD